MPYGPPLDGIFWGHDFCKYGGVGPVGVVRIAFIVAVAHCSALSHVICAKLSGISEILFLNPLLGEPVVCTLDSPGLLPFPVVSVIAANPALNWVNSLFIAFWVVFALFSSFSWFPSFSRKANRMQTIGLAKPETWPYSCSFGPRHGIARNTPRAWGGVPLPRFTLQTAAKDRQR